MDGLVSFQPKLMDFPSDLKYKSRDQGETLWKYSIMVTGSAKNQHWDRFQRIVTPAIHHNNEFVKHLKQMMKIVVYTPPPNLYQTSVEIV